MDIASRSDHSTRTRGGRERKESHSADFFTVASIVCEIFAAKSRSSAQGCENAQGFIDYLGPDYAFEQFETIQVLFILTRSFDP